MTLGLDQVYPTICLWHLVLSMLVSCGLTNRLKDHLNKMGQINGVKDDSFSLQYSIMGL